MAASRLASRAAAGAGPEGGGRLQWGRGAARQPRGPGWGEAWERTDRDTRGGGTAAQAGAKGGGAALTDPSPTGAGAGAGRGPGRRAGSGRSRGLLAGNPGLCARPCLKAQAPRAPALKGVGRSPRAKARPWPHLSWSRSGFASERESLDKERVRETERDTETETERHTEIEKDRDKKAGLD